MSINNIKQRIARVSALIYLAGKIDDYPKIHYMIYILQEHGFNFNFSFKYFPNLGMFSDNLFLTLQELQELNIIPSTDSNITLIKHFYQLDQSLFPAKELIQKLNTYPTNILGLVAIIYFLKRKFQGSSKAMRSELKQLRHSVKVDEHIFAWEIYEQLEKRLTHELR